MWHLAHLDRLLGQCLTVLPRLRSKLGVAAVAVVAQMAAAAVAAAVVVPMQPRRFRFLQGSIYLLVWDPPEPLEALQAMEAPAALPQRLTIRLWLSARAVAVAETLVQQVRGAVEARRLLAQQETAVVAAQLAEAPPLATAAGAEGVLDRAAMAPLPAPIMVVIVCLSGVETALMALAARMAPALLEVLRVVAAVVE